MYLRTDKFIKNLYISCKDRYIKMSDNYFDMIANKNYKVFVLPNHYGEQAPTLTDLEHCFQFRSYVQIYSSSALEVIQE